MSPDPTISTLIERLPFVRGLVRWVRGEQPPLMLDVAAARGPDARPGLLVTVRNAGASELRLREVGVVYSTLRPIGLRVGVPLRVGEAHDTWLGLAELTARSGRREPVSGIVSAFARTSAGTGRVRVDGERLLAELRTMFPPA